MEMKAKSQKNNKIKVCAHAIEKYLRVIKAIPKSSLEGNLDKQINKAREDLINILKNSKEIDIPESCKVLSLVNNNFEEARYLYSSKDSILIVLNKDKTSIITCYEYYPESSQKEIIAKAKKTLKIEQIKSKYHKKLEIKKSKSKYNEKREFYRKERKWN